MYLTLCRARALLPTLFTYTFDLQLSSIIFFFLLLLLFCWQIYMHTMYPSINANYVKFIPLVSNNCDTFFSQFDKKRSLTKWKKKNTNAHVNFIWKANIQLKHAASIYLSYDETNSLSLHGYRVQMTFEINLWMFGGIFFHISLDSQQIWTE